MAYFVVHALDAPGRSDIRAEHRPAHRARLRAHDFALVVRIGGPLLDETGAMCGTTLIVEADDRQTVEAFVQGDPYAEAGLYGEVNIHPFNWGLTQLEDT